VEPCNNTNIALLPASLDSTLAEFLASPLCTGILSLLLPLFISLKIIMHWHLFILGQKRDPKLLRVEEVVSSGNHIETFDLDLLVYGFPLLRFY